ncbi:MAG: hypothetical protein V4613_08565 [Bacteroidota bacterium]
MKKYLTIGLLFVIALSHVNAQDGDTKHMISAGFGAPNIPKTFFNFLSKYDNFKSKGTGPFHLKYEYKPTWVFGIGANLNYMKYQVSFVNEVLDTVKGVQVPNNVSIDCWNAALNIRANIHFIKPDDEQKSDVYFGMGLGYRFGKFRVSSDYEDQTPSFKLPSLFKMGFETTLGYRYLFTKNLGAYVELGAAKSIIQFGITGAF